MKWIVIGIALLVVAAAGPQVTYGAITERVSVTSDETEGDSASAAPSLSADGNLVAFQSLAVLAPGGGGLSVYLRDRSAGTTVLVSADGFRPAISADGRFVAFHTFGALVSGDTNGVADVYVHDLDLGTTRRVSINSREKQGFGGSAMPSISADGRYVAFESVATNMVGKDTNGVTDIFVRDRQLGTTMRVSLNSKEGQASGNSGTPSFPADSYDASISGTGRFVAFTSGARNLVAGDTNLRHDIFLRDRKLGTTRRVSVSSSEKQANRDSAFAAISGSGRFTAFVSGAKNLVSGDTNGTIDVFVRDRKLEVTRRVSLTADGSQADAASGIDRLGISAGGRYVVFVSGASLVTEDTNGLADVYVRDRIAGTTTQVSVDSSGAQVAFGDPHLPALSGNGLVAAFQATGSGFVANDTNDAFDVFVRSP